MILNTHTQEQLFFIIPNRVIEICMYVCLYVCACVCVCVTLYTYIDTLFPFIRTCWWRQKRLVGKNRRKGVCLGLCRLISTSLHIYTHTHTHTHTQIKNTKTTKTQQIKAAVDTYTQHKVPLVVVVANPGQAVYDVW